MKFATDENILKTYNYASVGKVSETLTVTNKRVILATEGKMPDGSAIHTTEEIKINSIEKVQATVASKRKGSLIFFTILFALIAVAFAAITVMGIKLFGETLQYAAAGGALLIAIICIIAYALSKRVSFCIDLTTRARSGMGLSDSVGTLKIKKSKKQVKIKVDEKVAIEVVEEIGALIIESEN